MESTKIEPQKLKSDSENAKDFFKEYEQLCEKHGFRIVVNPAFIGTNHGTFEVVLQTSVGLLPKQQ